MPQVVLQPTLCLVDFDGCINVLQPGPIAGYLQSELDGYTLQGNPVALAGLDHVIRECRLVPVWASMWGKRAPEAGRRLGIGADWPALTFEYPDPDGSSASFLTDGLDGVAELKLPVVQLLVGREPFIWIDDDITPRLERWALRRNRKVPTLLITPNPRIGVTMLHLEDLIRFAHEVQAWREERASTSTSPHAA